MAKTSDKPVQVHRIRLQYQIGKSVVYSNHLEVKHKDGITVQQLYAQMITFLAGARLCMKDDVVYKEACKAILDKLFQHAAVCNMLYIPAKYTESILRTKRSFKSKKFKGERIDLEIRLAVVPFIDDGGIISQVIKIFRNAQTKA